MMDGGTKNISNRIQELLGAREPTQTGQVGEILSSRFSGPSYGDYASGVVQSALGKPTMGGDIADSRMDSMLKRIAAISEMQKQGAGDLPQGYRMNPQTGQAELIPGVDASFGKKADPYAMPMPVIMPDGKPGFAPKRDVVNNPDGFKPIPTDGQGDFKRENTIRDEFNTLTKDFRTVQDAFSKIQQTTDSGAGDMSMLYAYVKLLDPGSVVRESEFSTAAASGSYGERIQGAVKGILTGGRLPPSQRKEFMNEASRIYAGQKLGYDRTKQTYSDIANRYGLDPKNVITDYTAAANGTTEEPGTLIGTSGGKKVYQLPDGSHVMEQ